jgi:hypothetical protein
VSMAFTYWNLLQDFPPPGNFGLDAVQLRDCQEITVRSSVESPLAPSPSPPTGAQRGEGRALLNLLPSPLWGRGRRAAPGEGVAAHWVLSQLFCNRLLGQVLSSHAERFVLDEPFSAGKTWTYRVRACSAVCCRRANLTSLVQSIHA